MFTVEQLGISTSCREPWDEMDGTPRARYCESCRHYVYNLEGMSDSAAATLIERYESSSEVTLYRRPDGTVTTSNRHTGLAAVRERAAVGALVAAACILGMLTAGSQLQATLVRASTPAVEHKVLTRPTGANLMHRCSLRRRLSEPMLRLRSRYEIVKHQSWADSPHDEA